MKNSHSSRSFQRLVIVVVALCAFSAMPMLSRANSSTSLVITNNSSRQIRNLYFSHVNADDWGNNQLGDGGIAPGQSYTIANIQWDQQQFKVVAEDQEGCFLTTVVTAGGNATWTVSNDTAADCGY